MTVSLILSLFTKYIYIYLHERERNCGIVLTIYVKVNNIYWIKLV